MRLIYVPVGGIHCRLCAEALKEMRRFPQTERYLHRLNVLALDPDSRGRDYLQGFGGVEATDESTFLQTRLLEVCKQHLESDSGQPALPILMGINLSSPTFCEALEVMEKCVQSAAGARFLVFAVQNHPQTEDAKEQRYLEIAKESKQALNNFCGRYPNQVTVYTFHRNAFGGPGETTMAKGNKEAFMELAAHVLWLILTSNDRVWEGLWIQNAGKDLVLGHVQVDQVSGCNTSLSAQVKLSDCFDTTALNYLDFNKRDGEPLALMSFGGGGTVRQDTFRLDAVEHPSHLVGITDYLCVCPRAAMV